MFWRKNRTQIQALKMLLPKTHTSQVPFQFNALVPALSDLLYRTLLSQPSSSILASISMLSTSVGHLLIKNSISTSSISLMKIPNKPRNYPIISSVRIYNRSSSFSFFKISPSFTLSWRCGLLWMGCERDESIWEYIL